MDRCLILPWSVGPIKGGGRLDFALAGLFARNPTVLE